MTNIHCARTRPAYRAEPSYYPTERELKKARGNAVRVATYCIEGEWVTMQQIAERLGITRVQVSDRMRRERKKPGPLTWEGLAR